MEIIFRALEVMFGNIAKFSFGSRWDRPSTALDSLTYMAVSCVDNTAIGHINRVGSLKVWPLGWWRSRIVDFAENLKGLALHLICCFMMNASPCLMVVWCDYIQLFLGKLKDRSTWFLIFWISFRQWCSVDKHSRILGDLKGSARNNFASLGHVIFASCSSKIKIMLKSARIWTFWPFLHLL